MSRAFPLSAAALALLVACEDGPKQIFTPNTGDPAQQSGYAPNAPYTEEGEASYDYTAGQGDNVERARFCDERTQTETIDSMVAKPIIPDVGLGGLKMWSAAGTPAHANDYIGLPSDGKFCDPEVYSNALTWGPTYEIIAFINEETKLVETLVATSGYQGRVEGQYTAQDGSKVSVVAQMRERMKVGTVQLDQYTDSTNQEKTPNSWLNHARINEMYRMVRETFFGAAKFASDAPDCFDTSICGVIYTASDETQPQDTIVLFRDSGLYLVFAPEGTLTEVDIEPVKLAKFETSTSISLLDVGKVAPKITSESKPGCVLDLSGKTFKDFQTACIDADDTRTLPRAGYDVYTQRDAVDVNFNGVTLGFMRRATPLVPLKDGERPGDTDTLFSLSFYRDLNAPVTEFVPRKLGADYKTRIEAKVHALVAASPGHPFATWSATIPSLSNSPSPIGGLTTSDDASVLDAVGAELRSEYETLSAADKKAVARVLHPTFAIEPFVDAVLAAFTNGRSDEPETFKGFYSTDDRRWSIGEAHFKQGTARVRVIVQYSLNYGAVTAVTLEQGASLVDDQYDALVVRLDPTRSYYGIDLSYYEDDEGKAGPISLGGKGIQVKGFDRQLKMLDIGLQVTGKVVDLKTPGTSIEDQGGFKKQLRGERWEFVPAHEVKLLGKETALTFYVAEQRLGNGEGGCTEAAGCVVQSVVAASESYFKAPMELCEGLAVRFGDDVRAAIEDWTLLNGPAAARQCEIVFNYSANGNVLFSVTSLVNKISFSTSDGRATAVTLWQ